MFSNFSFCVSQKNILLVFDLNEVKKNDQKPHFCLFLQYLLKLVSHQRHIILPRIDLDTFFRILLQSGGRDVVTPRTAVLFNPHCTVCFIKKQQTHALAFLSIFFQSGHFNKQSYHGADERERQWHFFSLVPHNLLDENEKHDMNIKA